MSVINARGITYAIGTGSDRAVKNMDEGIEPYARPVIVPVTDRTTTPQTFKVKPGIGLDDFQIGTIYYQATIPLLFRPSNIRKLLDIYFEDVAVGGASGYARNYDITDIPSHPSKWLSLWKRTEHEGNAENEAYYGGVVHGLSLYQREGDVLKCDVTASFCRGEFDVAASGSWDAQTSGDRDSWRGQDISLTYGPYGSAAVGDYREWGLSLSHAIQPTFYANQYPDRITRRGFRISGYVTIRDDSATTQLFLDAMANKTVCILIATNSPHTIMTSFAVIGYEELFENNTRYMKFNFINVRGGSYDFSLDIHLEPGVS